MDLALDPGGAQKLKKNLKTRAFLAEWHFLHKLYPVADLKFIGVLIFIFAAFWTVENKFTLLIKDPVWDTLLDQCK